MCISKDLCIYCLYNLFVNFNACDLTSFLEKNIETFRETWDGNIARLFYLINSTHIAHCKLMFTQSFRDMALSSIKYTRIINQVYPTYVGK